MESLLPATTIPGSLTQAISQQPTTLATQNLVSVFASHTPADMKSLQQADPTISNTLVFWRRQLWPGPEERRKLTKDTLVLLGQWKRLVE